MSKYTNKEAADLLMGVLHQQQDAEANQGEKLVITPERQKIVNHFFRKFQGSLPLNTPPAQQNKVMKNALKNLPSSHHPKTANNRKFTKNLLFKKGGKRRIVTRKRKTRM